MALAAAVVEQDAPLLCSCGTSQLVYGDHLSASPVLTWAGDSVGFSQPLPSASRSLLCPDLPAWEDEDCYSYRCQKKKKAMNWFWKYLTCWKLFNTFFPEQEGKSRKRMVFSFFFLFWCVKNLGFGFHLENAKRETLPVWKWNTAIGFGQSKALSRKTATTIPLS